ncbi:hypothetical protein AYI69_g150 [Smittium culicis]|uniref:ELM2 domain-containing protein n=1 Tax=Smittium culicis TaxID=133412 RepID=A0A1R1YTS7_9FUNG|nr:hypothetical protein AYI69_g150 [Smittium culicis]
MACLDPPITRKPSKGYAWQCAPCLKDLYEQKIKNNQILLSKPDRTRSAATVGKRKISSISSSFNSSHSNSESKSPPNIPNDLNPSKVISGVSHIPEASYSRRGALNDDSSIRPYQNNSEIKDNTMNFTNPSKRNKEWPYRYFGMYSNLDDILYDDDRINPRAGSRIGPKYQAVIPELVNQNSLFNQNSYAKPVSNPNISAHKSSKSVSESKFTSRGQSKDRIINGSVYKPHSFCLFNPEITFLTSSDGALTGFVSKSAKLLLNYMSDNVDFGILDATVSALIALSSCNHNVTDALSEIEKAPLLYITENLAHIPPFSLSSSNGRKSRSDSGSASPPFNSSTSPYQNSLYPISENKPNNSPKVKFNMSAPWYKWTSKDFSKFESLIRENGSQLTLFIKHLPNLPSTSIVLRYYRFANTDKYYEALSKNPRKSLRSKDPSSRSRNPRCAGCKTERSSKWYPLPSGSLVMPREIDSSKPTKQNVVSDKNSSDRTRSSKTNIISTDTSNNSSSEHVGYISVAIPEEGYNKSICRKCYLFWCKYGVVELENAPRLPPTTANITNHYNPSVPTTNIAFTPSTNIENSVDSSSSTSTSEVTLASAVLNTRIVSNGEVMSPNSELMPVKDPLPVSASIYDQVPSLPINNDPTYLPKPAISFTQTALASSGPTPTARTEVENILSGNSNAISETKRDLLSANAGAKEGFKEGFKEGTFIGNKDRGELQIMWSADKISSLCTEIGIEIEAMWQTDRNNWVHSICALLTPGLNLKFTPNLGKIRTHSNPVSRSISQSPSPNLSQPKTKSFQNDNEIESVNGLNDQIKVYGVSSLPKSNFIEVCYVCKKKSGLVIHCSNTKPFTGELVENKSSPLKNTEVFSMGLRKFLENKKKKILGVSHTKNSEESRSRIASKTNTATNESINSSKISADKKVECNCSFAVHPYCAVVLWRAGFSNSENVTDFFTSINYSSTSAFSERNHGFSRQFDDYSECSDSSQAVIPSNNTNGIPSNNINYIRSSEPGSFTHPIFSADRNFSIQLFPKSKSLIDVPQFLLSLMGNSRKYYINSIHKILPLFSDWFLHSPQKDDNDAECNNSSDFFLNYQPQNNGFNYVESFLSKNKSIHQLNSCLNMLSLSVLCPTHSRKKNNLGIDLWYSDKHSFPIVGLFLQSMLISGLIPKYSVMRKKRPCLSFPEYLCFNPYTKYMMDFNLKLKKLGKIEITFCSNCSAKDSPIWFPVPKSKSGTVNNYSLLQIENPDKLICFKPIDSIHTKDSQKSNILHDINEFCYGSIMTGGFDSNSLFSGLCDTGFTENYLTEKANSNEFSWTCIDCFFRLS